MEKKNLQAKEKQLKLTIRNEFNVEGLYDFPIIKRQDVDLQDLELIGIGGIRHRERVENKKKVVHFFEYDHRFKCAYDNPPLLVNRLKQYRAVCSPDFSLYMDMPKALQILSVFKNRWCGAYYQRLGLKVIPTIAWAGEESFSFCFDGVEEGCVVAVSTVGVQKLKDEFLRGYQKMIENLKPSGIICYGKPFEEMMSFKNLIVCPYGHFKARG